VRVPSLGSRGQGWVYLQFLLIATVVAVGFLPPGWPASIDTAFAVAGVVLCVLGAGLVAWAIRALDRSLSPFPAPVPAGELVETGPYARVRHPVYTGGIVFFTGVSVVTGPWALLATGLLAGVWALKIEVEERFLRERYSGYADYCERVGSRLLPGIY
jgi:protein-S-isoprenylcysteine O-methyltransferase Ste14